MSQTHSTKLWAQSQWSDKTDNVISLKIEDPETITLLGKCLCHLILIALNSKEGLNEAYEEIVGINDFYFERTRFLPSNKKATLQEKTQVAEIVSTDVKEPFYFDFD